MVASRKPRRPARKGDDAALEATFQRLLALPADAPFPKLTERQARHFLKRLAGSNPDAPSGAEVLADFYGDWSEDEIEDDA